MDNYYQDAYTPMLKSLELESTLQRVGEIPYEKNTTKGNQLKPIFKDSLGNLLVGKEYSRISAANERIAYNLATLLNFPDVRIPEVRVGHYNGEPWIISRFIDVKDDYCLKNSPFQSLTSQQKQVGILFRLMANIDGNFRNVVRDSNDQVWFLDYEYSGYFHNYDKRFLQRDLKRAKQILNFFMRGGPTSINIFSEGIKRVNECLENRVLSQERLIEIGRNAGLLEWESEYYAGSIINTAEYLEDKIRVMCETWKHITEIISNKGEQELHSQEFIPFYHNLGYRCGPACIKIALDYFGEEVPSFAELDRELGREREQITWLVQIASYLKNKGFKLEYFADKGKLKQFLDIPYYMINHSLKDYSNETIKSTVFSKVNECISDMLSSSYIVEKAPTLNDLFERVFHDCIIICTVNNSIIYSAEDIKNHHVVITSIGKKNVYYHNVGPKNAKPNDRANLETFRKALEDIKVFDHNVLIVYPP